MALDEQNGGDGGPGGCLKCHGWGMHSERISAAESKKMMGDTVPREAQITYAHVTKICDCAAGDKVRKSMSDDR